MVAALVVAMLDSEAGFRTWLRLKGDLRAAEARIEALRSEIADLEREAAALESDSFAIEAAIREDLKLARPGEIVIHWVDDTSAGIP